MLTRTLFYGEPTSIRPIVCHIKGFQPFPSGEILRWLIHHYLRQFASMSGTYHSGEK
jgi:hypothetical protein